MSQVNPPTGVTAVTGTGTGRITVSFFASAGTAPTSYTATACTNAAMTTGCVAVASFATGGAVAGLTHLTLYFVTVTAIGPAGYLNATSSPPATATAS
jgi:hypothetical protein